MKHASCIMQLLTVQISLQDRNVLLLGADEHFPDLVRMILPCTERLFAAFPVRAMDMAADTPASVPCRTSGTEDPGTDLQPAADMLRDLEAEGRLRLLPVPLRREDLYGMDIVISALRDGRINDELFAVSRTLGIRICILQQPERSDFILKGIS